MQPQDNMNRMADTVAAFQMVTSPDSLSRMGITPEAFEGQSINEDVLSWYSKRFKQFYDDGVPEAVNCYIQHANRRTDINDITKVAIMQLSLQLRS